MKLHDITSDVLRDAANEFFMILKGAVRSRGKFVSKRVEELADISRKRARQCLVDTIEGEHVLHGLGSIALPIEEVSVEEPAMGELGGGAHHLAKRRDRSIGV